MDASALVVPGWAARRRRPWPAAAGLVLGVALPGALALYVPLWTVLYVFGTFHGQNMGVNGYRYMLPLHPIAWMSFASIRDW